MFESEYLSLGSLITFSKLSNLFPLVAYSFYMIRNRYCLTRALCTSCAFRVLSFATYAPLYLSVAACASLVLSRSPLPPGAIGCIHARDFVRSDGGNSIPRR